MTGELANSDNFGATALPDRQREHAVRESSASESVSRPVLAFGPDRQMEAATPVLTLEAERRILAALEQRHSPSTVRNYRQDWVKFSTWCALRAHTDMPAHPHVVADYLTEHAESRSLAGERTYSPATLARWVASINYWHRAVGLQAPGHTQTVKDTLAGIRRTYARAGERRTRRAAPLLTDDLHTLLAVGRRNADNWSTRARERRDAAILLLGFVGAFRRSELAGLAISDVATHEHDGLIVRLRMSKTDQTGEGQVKVLPYGSTHATCPPCAYRRWLEVVCAFDTDGRPGLIRLLHADDDFTHHVCRTASPIVPDRSAAVFRAIRANGNLSDGAISGAAVHAVIRRAASAADFPEDRIEALSGHSLRAGFVTQSFRNGADAHQIMRQTGHSNPATVELYAREHDPLRGNAVTRLGL